MIIERYEQFSFYIREDFFDKNILESEVVNNYRIPEGTKTVIDIGAHIGGTTVYAASRGAEVWAFEPEKENFELLKKNVELNKVGDEVHLINKGIGKDGKRRLYLNTINSGRPTLMKERASGSERYEYIDVISLDRAFKEYGIEHCDFMKIDCEGCEREFLFETSPETFAKIDMIVLEWHGEEERVKELLGRYYRIDPHPDLCFCYKKI